MAATYDNIRRDLQHIKEWRKVALLAAIDEQDVNASLGTKRTGSALSPKQDVFQQEQSTNKRSQAQTDISTVQMQELHRAYAQFGHLSTIAGPTIKANSDLWLHNTGAWGLTLAASKSVCGDCSGIVLPGWRFTTFVSTKAEDVVNRTLRGSTGEGDSGSRVYLCFHCTNTFLADHKALASCCIGTDEFRESIRRARARCLRLQQSIFLQQLQQSSLGARPPSDAALVLPPVPSYLTSTSTGASTRPPLAFAHAHDRRQRPRKPRKKQAEHKDNMNPSSAPGTKQDGKQAEVKGAFTATPTDILAPAPSAGANQHPEQPPGPVKQHLSVPPPASPSAARRPLIPRALQMDIAKLYGTTVRDWAPSPSPEILVNLMAALRRESEVAGDEKERERDEEENKREQRRRQQVLERKRLRQVKVDALWRGEHIIHRCFSLVSNEPSHSPQALEVEEH